MRSRWEIMDILLSPSRQVLTANPESPNVAMSIAIIRMYFAPGEHPPPYFHVYYAEYKATVDIQACESIESNLPRKQTRLVLARVELHQEDLMDNWHLVMNGEEPREIQPLQLKST